VVYYLGCQKCSHLCMRILCVIEWKVLYLQNIQLAILPSSVTVFSRHSTITIIFFLGKKCVVFSRWRYAVPMVTIFLLYMEHNNTGIDIRQSIFHMTHFRPYHFTYTLYIVYFRVQIIVQNKPLYADLSNWCVMHLWIW